MTNNEAMDPALFHTRANLYAAATEAREAQAVLNVALHRLKREVRAARHMGISWSMIAEETGHTGAVRLPGVA